MAILVIGAGLVGSQIARILVEEGETPILMDLAPQRAALAEIVDLARTRIVEGNILSPFVLTEIIREHGVTDIVHTAANPELTLGAQRDPYSAVQLNIMGTMNVLEAARIHKLRRVVVSSSNVLNHFLAGGQGDPDPTGPATEEAYPRPTTFYAASKQAIENLGLNYARWNGLDFAAMRYGAVAGPWNGRGGGGPSVVFCAAVETALRGGEALVPAGAMEWVYAPDAARATVLALAAKTLGSRIFNVTMGQLAAPSDFAAALMAEIPGTRVRIETPGDKGVSLPDMQRLSDLRLARDLLGYRPEFGLRAAIGDLAAWLRPRLAL